MPVLSDEACAKVNLTLRVNGRRADGYHDLESVVAFADCADRLERVADALGEPGDGTADGSRAVRAVQRVLADIGFPTLTDVGVTADDLPALVASATGEQSYNLDVDCHDWTPAEVEQSFRAALALERR